MSIDQTDTRATRTGWSALTGKPAVSKIVDTLLDLPGGREFNKSDLADLADVSRNTVGRHMDLLVDLGVVEEVSYAPRYRVDTDSEVFRLLTELDAAASEQLRDADGEAGE